MHRYDFHKESREDLIEFLKVAADVQKDSPQKVAVLNEYLAQLQNQPEQVGNVKSDENEICTISEAVAEVNETEKEGEERVVETQLDNSYITSDLADIVVENLLKEKVLTQNDLKMLVNCPKQQIEQIILDIKKQANVETVCSFGNALSICECENVNAVFHIFYQHLFYPLLSTEQTEYFRETFVCLYKKYHKLINRNDIITTLSQANCSTIFLENLGKLDVDYKDELLKDLLLNCRRIEHPQFKALEYLLDQKSHHSVIKMIVDVMVLQPETNDKAFGKLLITLINILGRNIHQLEQPLRYIIANHRSVWKSKIQKIFTEHYECSQLSQSLIKH